MAHTSSRRCIRHPAVFWFASFLALATILSSPAHARSWVLKADGSGDAPTFQAGIDSLASYAWIYPRTPDTLYVKAGFYDESVSIPGIDWWGWSQFLVVCPDGPAVTRVAALQFRDLATQVGTSTFRIESLGIAAHVVGGSSQPAFQGCVFEQGLTCDAFVGRSHGKNPTLASCTFLGPVDLSNFEGVNESPDVSDCRFEATLTVVTDGVGFMRLRGCIFAAPDTAVICRQSSDGITIFSSCRFSGSGFGVVDVSTGNYSTLRFSGCRFQDVSATAIRKDPGTSSLSGSNVEVDHSVIERCGLGVDLVFTMGGQDGPGFAHIVGNTIVSSSGPGIRVTAAEAPRLPGLTIQNNLLAFNQGPGISVPSYTGTVSHNDAWENAGGNYVGVATGEANLELNPLFCDFAAGDYEVASTSPCAPSGPFGQIGALGVGCTTVQVALLGNDRKGEVVAGSGGRLMLALLGGMVAPEQVDLATVRLGGVPLATTGGGRYFASVRDVNRDLAKDLVLGFEQQDLPAGAPNLTLQASTLSGMRLVGMAQVATIDRDRQQQQLSAEISTAPVELAIQPLANPFEGARLVVRFTVPKTSAAELILVDVAGRRVSAAQVPAGEPGERRLELNTSGLSSGVYFLRLSQDGQSTTSRVVRL